MSSWISVLILAKGSFAIWLAKAINNVLLSAAPLLFRRSTITSLPPSAAGAAPRSRRTDTSAELPCCRKEAASSASEAASMAFMASALVATASATPTLTPCCTKRIVVAEVLFWTTPLMMPMACVSVESSAARTLERWSQVLALCWHIVESLFVYSLSSSKVASTVVRRWLADTMSAMACSFSFLVSSSLWFSSLTMSVLAWVNISNSARESASILSVETFSARKSSWSFSKSARMPLEWKS
mmetsp:Transcript_131788/g.421695  ORF Transcript_131788/g.421695 Transcript_131788/m.421695 type:complete len:242 (+) Transcript_131788:740-1465(+)